MFAGGVSLANFSGPYEIGALLVVSIVLLMLTAAMVPTTWPTEFRRLAVVAVGVHLLGSFARMTLMLGWYGTGDFLKYYAVGLDFAYALREFDARPFLEAEQLWGTAFVERVTACVLLVVGPSLRAAFAVFSFFPTVGMLLIAITVLRAFRGNIDRRRLVYLLLLWPSLVFWPSSIGKESLMLLALGLVVRGWWGNGVRVQWPFLFGGLTLALFIRPHMAMMIAIALAVADWIAPAQRLSAGRIARGVFLAALAVFVGAAGLRQLGVEATQEAVMQFAAQRSARTAQGGSQFGALSGPLVAPFAFVNVLARPFLWEVRNPLSLLSSFEVLFFWFLLWSRRQDIGGMFRRWRESRLLLFVVPLTIVLVLFYGAFVSNMGILARQRVVVLPFMFILAEVAPAFRRRTPSVKPVGNANRFSVGRPLEAPL